jgi:hypothetical protein
MRNSIAAVAVLLLAGCGVNTAKITAEGQKLVAQFGPQVTSLAADGDALAAKLKSPTDVPALADLAAKISAHQGKLAALKSRVEGFPDDLAAVIQVGKDSDVTTLLEKFKKEVPEEIAAAGPRQQDLAGQLAALQAKAAEGAVSAAPASATAK